MSQGGTSVLSPLSCSFFLTRCIPVVSIVYICLIRILSLRSPVLQFQLTALLLVCVLFFFVLLFIVVLSGEPRQKQERGSVDHKLVQAPQYFLLPAVPRRLCCFWFFVDFRCGALLFMVTHVIYKYKNR